MAEITSGTVEGSPIGDVWVGTLELSATADDGDTINLGSSSFLGSKIVEILYAKGVRNVSSGTTADISPVSFATGTAKITLGKSGTYNSSSSGTRGIDDGRAALSNYTRHIFFVAKSQQ